MVNFWKKAKEEVTPKYKIESVFYEGRFVYVPYERISKHTWEPMYESGLHWEAGILPSFSSIVAAQRYVDFVRAGGKDPEHETVYL